MTYSTYILSDPNTKEIVYCGISKNTRDRYWSHMTRRKNPDNVGLSSWVQELKSNNIKPKMTVLCNGLTKEQAEISEKTYIKNLCTRFNIQAGGLIPPSQKGKVFTEEKKAQMAINSVLRKEVHQYSKEGNFIASYIGVRAACRITKIDHRSIAQVAGGSIIRKSAGGYIWKYN